MDALERSESLVIGKDISWKAIEGSCWKLSGRDSPWGLFQGTPLTTFRRKWSEPWAFTKLQVVMNVHSAAPSRKRKRALWQVQRTFLRLILQKSCLAHQT